MARRRAPFFSLFFATSLLLGAWPLSSGVSSPLVPPLPASRGEGERPSPSLPPAAAGRSGGAPAPALASAVASASLLDAAASAPAPAGCEALLDDVHEAPTDPSDLLFYVNRWRAIPAAFPVPLGSRWTPCSPGAAPGRLDLMCLPPSAWLQTAEALRRVAWRSPAPAGVPRTFDGLAVGFEGEVGFGAMFEAARRAGHELRVRSGFRPHDSQHSIFRSWVRVEQARGRGHEDATQRASAYSARPGHSEHQLGTTADLVFRVPHGRMYEGWDPEFIAGSLPMRWVAANAHRFGLVLSYGRDKTRATQYVWEPWHYRFVGVEAADAMRRCGLSTEEFLNARYRAGKQPDYLLSEPAVMGASTRLRPPRLAT